MIHQSTICAISSPPGMGGVALIRVSGPDAFSVVQKLTKTNITELVARSVAYCVIRDNETIIDECVVSKFIGPASFTGEDVIEIACHGSTYIQQQIMSALIDNGATLAQPGEFTMRAYLNGKMDLTQAEAIADLIASEDKMAHHMAVRQMKGGISKTIDELRQKLIDFASLIELELDFSEEDVEFADRDDLKTLVRGVINYVEDLISSFSLGNAIKNGIPVAILGRPNAGKSTLLNALLKEDRAIVSNIAGTTRDTIEEKFNIEGITYRLIDTAGIRSAQDDIEKIGIQRSLEAAEKASVVLYLYDVLSSNENDIQTDIEDLKLREDQSLIIVGNKVDESTNLKSNPDHIFISAQTGDSVDELKKVLASKNQINPAASDTTIISNVRHLEALKLALSDLQKVENGLSIGITGDLIAMDIRSSLRHLGSITGAISTDDLLGNIFGRFCIGK